MHAVGQVLSPWRVSGLRDGQWLREEMETLWAKHFSDAPRANQVDISFAGCWKSRLGVISLSRDSVVTYVGINSLLSLPEAPSSIARITIAHELVHYLHGFGSPLPRRQRHPHRGRVVEKELLARGFGEEYQHYEEWIHQHWYDFYERCALNPAVVTIRRPTGGTIETYESQ